MKVVTQQQIKEHNWATNKGAVEGVVGSTALALPAFWYLNRRWPYYRSLPIQLKFMGLVIVVAPAIVIQAERRGLEYEQSQWTGAGKEELNREAALEEHKWSQLSSWDKVKEWSAKHQYGIILAGWASSMVVATGIIWRRPFETPGQKIVQVRMWAQGITVGMIIAASILTATRRQEAAAHRGEDHSWRIMLEEQAREEEARKVKPLHAGATA